MQQLIEAHGFTVIGRDGRDFLVVECFNTMRCIRRVRATVPAILIWLNY